MKRSNGWCMRDRTEGDQIDSGRIEGGGIKTVGRRTMSAGGLRVANPFLKMVIQLRGTRKFIPKGVHRFRSFEEAQAWSIEMMARR